MYIYCYRLKRVLVIEFIIIIIIILYLLGID